MSNDPLTLDEQFEALAGIVLALSYVLSVDQREDAVRLLRMHADQSETPERTAVVLRRIAELMKRPLEPTQH